MLSDSDKRDYHRMCVDCSARFRVEHGGARGDALVKDLSASGVLLLVDDEILPGNRVAVEIRPGTEITPPLHAYVEVVRCDAADPATGRRFAVACSIERMLTENEAGPDFV